jgi:hypothetical protein
MTESFTPPPDGFGKALANVRRRRHRRRIAASLSGAALVAGAVVVATSGASDLASLRQVNPAGSGSPKSASTAPTVWTPPAQTSTRPIGGKLSTVPGQPPQPTTQPGAQNVVPTSASHQPIPISTSPVLRITDYNPQEPCADISGREASGWCRQPVGVFEGRPGKPSTLGVSLCRLPGLARGEARFPSSAEVELEIYASGDVHRLWALSSQHPGHPARHSQLADGGKCLTWAASWWNRDDRGRNLAPGQYSLQITIGADNIASPNDQVLMQNYNYTVR